MEISPRRPDGRGSWGINSASTGYLERKVGSRVGLRRAPLARDVFGKWKIAVPQRVQSGKNRSDGRSTQILALVNPAVNFFFFCLHAGR